MLEEAAMEEDEEGDGENDSRGDWGKLSESSRDWSTIPPGEEKRREEPLTPPIPPPPPPPPPLSLSVERED